MTRLHHPARQSAPAPHTPPAPPTALAAPPLQRRAAPEAAALGHHLGGYDVWPQSAEPQSAQYESAEPESAEPESAEYESAEPEGAEPQSEEPEEAEPEGAEDAEPESEEAEGADGDGDGGDSGEDGGEDAGGDGPGDGEGPPDDGPPVQAKLRVAAEGDPAEAEADRRAEAALEGRAAGPLSAAPARGEPLPGLGADVEAGVHAGIQQARGGGAPLPQALRAAMERSLGADFGGVRVHSGPGAHALSDALEARAFATGPDLFFGPSEYDPAGRAGRHLIAHELTHVAQQGAAPTGRGAAALSSSGGAAPPAPVVQRVRKNAPAGGTTAAKKKALNTTVATGGVQKPAKPKKPKKPKVIKYTPAGLASRAGTPTARAKKTMAVGGAVYDAQVLKNALKYGKRGGKNKKGKEKIHAAHRLSDKGLRDIHDNVVSGLVKPGADKAALTGLVQSLYTSAWDPGQQTKAHNTAVTQSRGTLQALIQSGQAPTQAQLAQINQGVKLLSNDSVKNLYPGDAAHNMARKQGPDFRVRDVPVPAPQKTGGKITGGKMTGPPPKPKLVRQLTPTSLELAKMIQAHNKMFPQTKGTAWADPNVVPPGYTNSALPFG